MLLVVRTFLYKGNWINFRGTNFHVLIFDISVCKHYVNDTYDTQGMSFSYSGTSHGCNGFHSSEILQKSNNVIMISFNVG